MNKEEGLGQLLVEDEFAFWVKLAGDEQLPEVIGKGEFVLSLCVAGADDFAEVAGIVRTPATIQSVKGLVSAGLGKSVKYSAAKIGKYWKGS